MKKKPLERESSFTFPDDAAGRVAVLEKKLDKISKLLMDRLNPIAAPLPKGKPGRRKTTTEIAQVIRQLRVQGSTWKEVLVACKSQFPGQVRTVEGVRTIWRRHFRGKTT